MPRLEDDSLEIARIDKALGEWRQGDIAPDIGWFVHVGDPAVALSEAVADGPDAGVQALTSATSGLVMLTQACDIVRSCIDRPYVELAPLVEVVDANLQDVRKGRRPSHAALPELMSERLVVDRADARGAAHDLRRAAQRNDRF